MCLTDAWEVWIRARYPDAAIYRRTMMKPACRFTVLEKMDVSTKEAHRGKRLATACVARMLRDCARRRITVHWDAQNDVSRHLAEKFGFEIETAYSVYWL